MSVVPALVLDCDGVLADTERYGHLPAFNRTFEEFGLPVRWSDEEYARKVKVGGGLALGPFRPDGQWDRLMADVAEARRRTAVPQDF